MADSMEYIIKTQEYKDMYKIIMHPFVLEYQKQFQEAINAHDVAFKFLKELVAKVKSKIRKYHRKMFERQMEVHQERKTYLESLASKGLYDEVIIVPTVLSAKDELVVKEGQLRPLSLDQKELHEYNTSNKSTTDHAEAPSSIMHLLQTSSPFSPTLNPTLPPICYKITHSSELVYIGMRSHWMYVKDSTNTHTLWAGQGLWSDEVPMTEVLLRRGCEFVPGSGAIHIRLIKTPGGSFRLKLETLGSGSTTEVPDRGEKMKYWSPRRFEYGGRKFVWKGAKDSGMFAKSSWETLWETTKVWPVDGSKTGKMEDETIGPKLCWGEATGSALRTEYTIYFAAGLDQAFQEHCLASQLARHLRSSNPPHKDVKGVEAAAAVSGILGLMSALTDLV